MSRTTFFLVLALSLLVKSNAGFCAGHAWPEMAEFTAKVEIETSADRIFFEFPLIDVHGETRYGFICAGGSEKYLAKLGAPWDVNYVGPFACRLVEGKTDPVKSEDSLLSEDESPYWYSRGRLDNFRELTGSCARYPEYGALRHFRLRGFELTLSFGGVEVDKAGNPTYFTLTVSLRRDATITSPQAEQTGYLTPYKVGSSCDKVLKGNQRRMCRDFKNLGGSWTECDKIGR
ncbi:hypothetical protein [Candidatus Binatus sp.]|uniref:hypothetical protein n=1 Tax=Candidatus Binatus sp. TaxID=2811406 RepID=UPI002F92A7E1